MRKASNVRNAIIAPEFVNVTTYNDGFRLTISLHTSEDVYNHFREQQNSHAILYRGKYYLHWEEFYSYSMVKVNNQVISPFDKAFADAKKALKHLKIMSREAKIASLKAEIDCIKYAE